MGDRTGLVWGYVFSPGAAPQEVDSDTAARLLAVPDETCSLWLHFSLSNVATERWLTAHVAPPEEFLPSLREDVGSTRLEPYDDALAAVLHDVLFEFALDPDQVATVGLLVRPRFLVSARLRPDGQAVGEQPPFAISAVGSSCFINGSSFWEPPPQYA